MRLQNHSVMNNYCLTRFLLVALAVLILCVVPGIAQQEGKLIPDSKIKELKTKLAETETARSSARKKLAIKRVLRAGDALLEQNQNAPNRFEVLGVIFRGQQLLLGVDDSATHRAVFLDTCRQLAEAPNDYAAIRLDADLLLSQSELAKRGASPQARAEALRPLIKRYQDTQVEAKVVRIAMLMAIELGNVRLVGHLRQVIAERFAGDPEMINFQRDKLAGQVFGAPFIGRFEQSDGKSVRFPMDFLGITTALYFWSQKDGGAEDLKELAAAWKKVKREDAARLQFISFNLDDLPDAGESILRDLGLDWPAIKMPGGKDHPIYKTYARRDPSIITVSPTGYAAIFLSGGRRSRGYERNLQSMLARVWTQPRYTSQLQSVFMGEYLVMDTLGKFNPAAPPEWKAIAGSDTNKTNGLKRTAASVPEDQLHAIQACFIQPPLRYRTPVDQVRAGFEKADALCRKAIADHSAADDLWIVRNRRIIALLGLWQLDRDQTHFEAAVAEAETAIESGYPAGTDIVARFCLAKQALRADDSNPSEVINTLIKQTDGDRASGPAIAAASVLALDSGDRKLHEQYRTDFLAKHTSNPMMWTAASFLLNRYHRYWLYHPPFVAGWTYGRRQGHFLAIGQAEDAQRTLQVELKTLDGKSLRIPEDTAGKWTVIEFVSSAEGNLHLQRYGTFVEGRPFDDVLRFAAVLGEDANTIRMKLKEKKKPDPFPMLLVPNGLQNPIVKQLGILAEDEKPNLLILRPDGGIAAALSGLTMKYQKDNVIQNVMEWHDEKAVDEALNEGNLEEAKRLAFAFAPREEPASPDSKTKTKPTTISIPHRRSRAKVYMAMKDWEAALADIQETYLQVNSKAGWLSMRTNELEKTENLKAKILAALEQEKSEK